MLKTSLAPLFDRNGKTAFFLGGQINCSTTVHSHSDIMRVLSTHDEEELDDDTPAAGPTAGVPLPRSRYAGFLQVFKNQKSSDSVSIHKGAGMEQNLVNRIERMKFKDQVDQFYTAYSKVRNCLLFCLLFVLGQY